MRDMAVDVCWVGLRGCGGGPRRRGFGSEGAPLDALCRVELNQMLVAKETNAGHEIAGKERDATSRCLMRGQRLKMR